MKELVQKSKNKQKALAAGATLLTIAGAAIYLSNGLDKDAPVQPAGISSTPVAGEATPTLEPSETPTGVTDTEAIQPGEAVVINDNNMLDTPSE